MTLAATTATRRARSLTRAAHAAFVPTGMVTVLLGPLLPTLSAWWSLNYAQAGSLFTAQFAGATVGTSLSGVIVARRGFRFAMAVGLLAMAVGVAALPFSSHFMGLACIFCYGGGIGVAIPAGNLLVAAINPERRSAALSLLNFSWSLGAVACPFVVGAVVRTESMQLFLLPLAGCLLLVLGWIAATPAYGVKPASKPDDEYSGVSGADWNSPSFFILAGLFFLYVGVENAFGGWVASYSKSLGTGSPTVAVMTPSFFYGAVLIGRWVAPFALEKFDDIKAARAGLSIACIGMIGLIVARSLPLVVSSAAVAGFGLAAVYPITISMLSREFGTAASRIGSVMFTLANFGGASLPWVVGYASHRFNSLAVGLAVPLAATVMMYVLYHGKWASKAIRPQPS